MAAHRPRRMASPMLRDFLHDTWLPSIASTIRPTTLLGYESHVRRHIGPRLGRLRLAELDAPTINRFYAELLAGDGTGRKLSATTVRRVHATLRRALRDAVRWGLLEDNPARHSDPPRAAAGGNGEMRTWDADQVRAFLAHVRGDDLYPLWVVLVMTGMRRGEALGLCWDDVDLDGGRIAIRRTVVAVGGDVQWSTPKTARGRRVIALDAGTVDVLRRWSSARRQNRSALVFARDDGSPLDPCWVSKRFRSLVRGSGLPSIRLHDLRHTHATLALRAGIHPKIVSERLGHATVAITLDVYSHALSHLQTEAAAAVGRFIWGRSGRRASSSYTEGPPRAGRRAR